MTSDLAGPAARSRRDAPEQDQTRLSGIESRPGTHSQGSGAYQEDGEGAGTGWDARVWDQRLRLKAGQNARL
jgi:hypothetical protein